MVLILSSFVAGIFTFFAPCTLPLIPGFLAILGGMTAVTPSSGDFYSIRRRIVNNAFLYVAGFSVIFIILGASAASLARIVGAQELLQRIGGVLIIIFGLSLIGLLRLPFFSVKTINISWLSFPSPLSSFVMGGIFALGWSPCVGPILGSVLLLASQSGTIFQGVLLLAVFSLGLGLPFIVAAFFLPQVAKLISSWQKAIEVLNHLSGVFLVLLGIFLLLGRFNNLIAWFISLLAHFPSYERFLNQFF